MESLKTKTENFLSFQRKRHAVLKNSLKIAADEFKENICHLAEKPSAKSYLHLWKQSTLSTVWIGKNIAHLAAGFTNIPQKKALRKTGKKERSLALMIANKKKIDLTKHTHEELFASVFHELRLSHNNSKYKSKLICPKINATLVLVPGVFNELFSTPPFERACLNLLNKNKIKYVVAKANGAKSSRHNSKQIRDFLKKYIKDNPNEKLWIFAFSKGGIDSLHFLRDNKDFANKYVVGFSAVASPILGSDHIEHRVISLANSLDSLLKIPPLKLDKDLVQREFQKSLSTKFQRPWFEKNHKNLPNLFYTSLALESKWHESHFWMIFAKMLINSSNPNDGVVDINDARFPDYFNSIHLGTLGGHHLVGNRSSSFPQEALLEAHIITLNYLGLLK